MPLQMPWHKRISLLSKAVLDQQKQSLNKRENMDLTVIPKPMWTRVMTMERAILMPMTGVDLRTVGHPLPKIEALEDPYNPAIHHHPLEPSLDYGIPQKWSTDEA